MQRPSADEYAPFFATYVSKVPEGDIVDVLHEQVRQTEAFLIGVSDDAGLHRYAPGKWSVKEVLGHMIDTERVMAYRAVCIARGDQTPLPAFDENAYVAAAAFDQRPIAELLYDFLATRQASIRLVGSFTDESSRRLGTASGRPISARALAYIIAGHELHHRRLLQERYGLG